MAIAEQMLAARFNTKEHAIFDHYTYVLSGDGCMMEGVTSEAASLAGHLKLGKLIVLYDSNHITIEGSTDLAFSEDVLSRYSRHTGGRPFRAMPMTLRKSTEISNRQKRGKRPSIILLRSVIGKGSYSMEGFPRNSRSSLRRGRNKSHEGEARCSDGQGVLHRPRYGRVLCREA